MGVEDQPGVVRGVEDQSGVAGGVDDLAVIEISSASSRIRVTFSIDGRSFLGAVQDKANLNVRSKASSQ